MRRRTPHIGDYLVEYRHLSRPGAARVAVVHLTADAGPEELFSSSAPGAGERAESLATMWAIEDGALAWRVLRNDGGEDLAEPIGVVVSLRNRLPTAS